ncbi:hypothetical protein [Croceicoccus sp. BE223]|uniref:hypothetical protein n=1 Tax=Croceicoccus sp. BE223 TaxID=2817716 RepID=UPI0028553EC5|nr:hypothetical protein [Croceicoccus sp. BE223]MDR7101492.1 hypothetical protein [Croceicoccus sp. BE223]
MAEPTIVDIGTRTAYIPTATPERGGGTEPPDMESRVNRLEDRLDKLIDRVGSVEVSVATLSERVSHLPSKTYIDTRLAGMLAVIAALIAFGDKIQAFVN